MKILYGIQGTGHGHISRSRILVRSLREAGHDIRVIFSGRSANNLWEKVDFDSYQIFRGLTFAVSGGKISYFKTAVQGLDLLHFYRDVLHFDPENFDLVITDYEPVTSRIAKRHALPSVGLGHQYAFRYEVPKQNQHSFSWKIMRNFAPAQIEVGLHWHHFNSPILPPVIEEFPHHTKIDPYKILVYLPFEEENEIIDFLNPVKHHDFYIYRNISSPFSMGNLHFRPYNKVGFHLDLLDCAGVICNAGFELPSEAQQLGKKLLVKPLNRQIEQESNALAVSQLGLGIEMRRLNPQILVAWLNLPNPDPIPYFNTAGLITEWLSSQNRNDVHYLSQQVRQKFPAFNM